MGLFNRTTKAAISPAPAKAAAAGAFGGGYSPNSAGLGAQMIGQYYTYQEGEARNRAVSVPTINRARDLMASVIGCMPLKMYNEMWNGNEMEKMPLAPRTWLRSIDPTVPNNFILSWTFDDLFFYGRAFWYVTSRSQSDGRPASFTRLPAAMINTLDQAGPVWFAPSKQIQFQGGELNPDDVVQFLSPIQGIIYISEQSVATALKLEAACYRNSSSAIPASDLVVSTDGVVESSHAKVRARFANFGRQEENLFDLIWENGGWRVDNIRNADWDLRAMLAQGGTPLIATGEEGR